MTTRTTIDLPPAVSGERREIESRSGTLNYYVAGPAPVAASAGTPPLLLIHSVNAAASAYEVKPLYEHYRTRRRVYALELPGFGFSERPQRLYDPRLMTDGIHAMLEEIARRDGRTPIDALALSLSSEFLVRAATENPSAFRSVALVSPTGFDSRAPYRGPPGSNRGRRILYNTFTFPLWSRAFFSLLTSRASIRYFLRKTWGSPHIDEGMVEYDYRTAHQPGARHAPYSFVSGFLFSNDITALHESLALPVFMAHGVRGDFTDYTYKRAFTDRPNWHFRVFETGALPHFEVLAEFVGAYDTFLSHAQSRERSRAMPELRNMSGA